MSGEILLTVAGNLTRDPELRITGTGKSVTNFSIAQTARGYDKTKAVFVETGTVFMNCTAWGDLADHVNDSLRKGDRVIATGRLHQRDYETEGTKRTVLELIVDDIGPSLKWATAKVIKTDTAKRGQTTTQPADDEPPF